MGQASSARRAARYALRLLMQHLSQEIWVSIWRRDLEYLLWAAIDPAQPTPPWPLSREQAHTLAWLAQHAGGWYYWAPDEVAVTFIERAAWEPLFQSWRQHRVTAVVATESTLPF
jgi:hypothetical protein